MLIIGIIFLLIISSAVTVYLRFKGLRLAYAWLILLSSVSLIWLILLVIRPVKISPFYFQNWININNSPVNLLFKIDDINWPISVSYFSFLLAYLLTSIVRLNGNKSLFDWLEMIILIISGWIFLLARDYWSILIGWTLIDFVELIVYLRYKNLNSDNFFFHFSVKFVGSMLLVYVISRSFQVSPLNLFENKIRGIGLVIPLAAFLHSGILSNFSEQFIDEENSWNSNIKILKIISFITSFFLLTYIPVPNISIITNLVLQISLFAFALTEMYKWAASNGIPGIQRILFAFAAVICLMFLSGIGEFISIWLIALLVPIGWLYLFSERDVKLQIYLVLAIFFISGLPFSLTYQGLNELVIRKKWIDLFFVSTPLIIALSGCIHHGLKQAGKFNDYEPWYQVFYLTGLFLPIFSLIAIGLINIRAAIGSLEGWWIGLINIVLAVLIYYLQFRRGKRFIDPFKNQRIGLGWLPKVLAVAKFIFKEGFIFLDNLLLYISRMFEGDGGILWSIVFLALFLTILKLRGSS